MSKLGGGHGRCLVDYYSTRSSLYSSFLYHFRLDTYYSVLIAWVMNAFFDSWSDDAPWNNAENNATASVDYFINDIIGASTLGPDGRPTRLVGANVGYCFLVWVIIYLCIAFGIKWTGRLTYFVSDDTLCKYPAIHPSLFLSNTYLTSLLGSSCI